MITIGPAGITVISVKLPPFRMPNRRPEGKPGFSRKFQSAVLAAVMSGAIDFAWNSREQSIAMRHLMAILGVLAMLVTLSGPVAALAATAPCHDASMAKMAMAGDDMPPCKPAAKACAAPCLAVGNCQSQCGFAAPLVRIDPDDLALPLFEMKLQASADERPPGTDPPVDGPPPRA